MRLRIYLDVLRTPFVTRLLSSAVVGRMPTAMAGLALVLLVLLVLGHFAIMHVLDGGLERINFAFVSGRWANPFWRVYDFAMLTLALAHGGNGLRVIIDDYARTGGRRLLYQSVNATVIGLTWALGTLTIFAFTGTKP